MLQSLNASTPVANSKPVRRRDYSVELQRSGPATLPAIYRNLHIVGLVLRDAVVVRGSPAGELHTRFARGDSYIRAVGPGDRVTWPAGMHALYVHLHPRLVRRLGEQLLGVPGLTLQTRPLLRDGVLRDIGFELHRLIATEPRADLRVADDLVLAVAHHVTAAYGAAATPTPRIGAFSVEAILDEFRDNTPSWEGVSSVATRVFRHFTGMTPGRYLAAHGITKVQDV